MSEATKGVRRLAESADPFVAAMASWAMTPLYFNSFEAGTEILLEACEDDVTRKRLLPVLAFVARRTLELALKDLINEVSGETSKKKKKQKQRHDLDGLWTDAREHIECYNADLLDAPTADQVIASWHAADPHPGTTFAYPDGPGSEEVLANDTLDIVRPVRDLLQVVKQFEAFLSGIEEGLIFKIRQ